ncbi:protein Tob1 [Strongylocentrotus purpuratus]|uniref:Anti-proliferative protein domain-containing protein n=1 Tax=Strongylocentrotus purpuratus TaxID=7668 RepID=A0A7M7RDY3_STRPU|nr:protein Tob1 [Strongylocentrotus purpuratus]|eukprot:XP_793565.3 PREDICTED: protein Tob1-like [Strongylocentrotus purpuratus]
MASTQSMKSEVQCAVDFLRSHLYNKLPRRRVNVLAEEIEKALYLKFGGHWYPGQPNKGSGYRCIRINRLKVDPAVESAIIQSGLDVDEVVENLPQELTMWMDPGEVSYRITEKGVVTVIYKQETVVEEGAEPEAPFSLVDSLGSSLQGFHINAAPSVPSTSGTTSPVAPGSPGGRSSSSSTSTSGATTLVRPNALTFTAASFAQTKFGSTKPKNSGKRVNFQQLSPTEFANYMKQRSAMKNYRSSQRSPQQLSPNAREFVPSMQNQYTTPWSDASGTPGAGIQTTHASPTSHTTESWFLPEGWGLPTTSPADQYNQQPSMIAAN